MTGYVKHPRVLRSLYWNCLLRTRYKLNFRSLSTGQHEHALLAQGAHTSSDERLGPGLPRGRGKSIGEDLDVDDEGSQQMSVTLQSLHHCSIGY
jgi:hypothetical protein